MTMTRNAMLQRLKALPDSKLSEIIFAFDLNDTIPQAIAPVERAIALIRAVEALGSQAWEKLELKAAVEFAPTVASSRLARSRA